MVNSKNSPGIMVGLALAAVALCFVSLVLACVVFTLPKWVHFTVDYTKNPTMPGNSYLSHSRDRGVLLRCFNNDTTVVSIVNNPLPNNIHCSYLNFTDAIEDNLERSVPAMFLLAMLLTFLAAVFYLVMFVYWMMKKGSKHPIFLKVSTMSSAVITGVAIICYVISIVLFLLLIYKEITLWPSNILNATTMEYAIVFFLAFAVIILLIIAFVLFLISALYANRDINKYQTVSEHGDEEETSFSVPNNQPNASLAVQTSREIVPYTGHPDTLQRSLKYSLDTDTPSASVREGDRVLLPIYYQRSNQDRNGPLTISQNEPPDAFYAISGSTNPLHLNHMSNTYNVF